MSKAITVPVAALVLGSIFWVLVAGPAVAHHILGRPAYGLNEDSNTPSSIQGEAQVKDYMITFMVFPAFPKPEEPGRVHLYVKRIDNGTPFKGKVTFSVQKESFLPGHSDHGQKLGVQPPDDSVFRQSFQFHEAGDYLITAEFEADNKPYHIEFSVRVGAPPLLGTWEIIFGLMFLLIVGISLVQRRRTMTGKIKSAHESDGREESST